MERYTERVQRWLDGAYSIRDGKYSSHQPIYGLNVGPTEGSHLRRFARTFSILRAINQCRFDTVLDVGGGEGYLANLIAKLFGAHAGNLSMSSTKSAIGHLLGAAGAVEAIFSIRAINDNLVPPTLNLDNPSPGSDAVDLVPHRAKERRVDVALSNSFGFGGTNASLVLARHS